METIPSSVGRPIVMRRMTLGAFSRVCREAPDNEIGYATDKFLEERAISTIMPPPPPPPPPPPHTESASSTQDDDTIAELDVSATASEISTLRLERARVSLDRENQQIALQRNEIGHRMEIADRMSRHEMELAEGRNRSEIGIAERKAVSDAENARISALAEAKRIEAEAERIRAEAKKTEAEAEKLRIEVEKDRLGVPAIPQRHVMANIRTKLELVRDMGFSESGMEALRAEYSGFFGIARVDVVPPPQVPIQPPIVVVVPSPPPPPPPQQDRAPVSQVAPRTYHQMRVSDFLVPQGVGAVQPQQIPPAVVRARPIGTFVLETWLSLQGKDDMSHGRLSVFGKRVSKTYRERHGGVSPKKRGAWNAYTDADSDMIEEIYRTMRP
jgi:hypothetical protein